MASDDLKNVGSLKLGGLNYSSLLADMWSSLDHVGDMASDDLKNVGSLKLGGLNYSSLLTDMCSLIGSQLTSLKIETVHCEVDVSLVGKLCDNLEELSVINARVEGTDNIP